MAKRDAYSSGPISGGNNNTKSSSESPAAAVQVAQTNTGTGSQPLDLNAAPVMASFTSTAPGTRIELPPGTAIDLVLVKDGDLYLVQPDGSVVVIVGGGTNVPTLVLSSGAVIPFERLEVALEGAQEGVPTAGPDASGPGSSGGNFTVNPGDIGGPSDFSGLLGASPFGDSGIEGDDLEKIIANGLPSIADAGGVAVEEDDLPLGANEDGSSGKTIAMGNLGVDFGPDGPGTVTFDPGIAAPLGLTSQGEQLSYVISADGTLLTAVTARGLEVFTVEIDPSEPGGKYIFTLLGPLDHLPQTEPLENNLDLLFGFIVTDANGDTAAGIFTVSAQDDIPVALDGAMDVADEAEIADAVVIDLSSSVNFGADGPAAGGGFSLIDITAGNTLTPAVLDNDGNALTSGGDAVVFSSFTDAAGVQTLIATANGVTVFTVALTGAGQATFTLLRALDHVPDFDQFRIDVSALINVSDFDGDTISLPDDFVIFKVDDDVPQVVGDMMMASLDEDDLLLPFAWGQRGLDIDSEAEGDRSGESVDMSSDGNTVVIGAPRNDGAPGENSGHARVFDWDGTAWVQRGDDIDGEAAFDHAGRSVAISNDGNTVIVGAPFNDDTNDRAGHARIFDWDPTANSSAGAWVQRGDDIDGDAEDDIFGTEVAMSGDGNTVVIGAPDHGGNALNAPGQIKIFDWDPSANSGAGAWVQRGPDIDGEEPGDHAPDSLGISDDGNTVIIGADENSGGFGVKTSSGHARIFDWDANSGTWIQRGLDIDPEAETDNYGRAVAISSNGDTVIIGAILNDGNGDGSGHARIFDWNGTGWVQRGQDLDGEAPRDKFGDDVAISADGNTVIIGARDNDATGSGSGHVRIFDWDAGSNSWVQRGIDIDGEPGQAVNQFGASVAISDDANTIVASAPSNDDNGSQAGHTQIYDWRQEEVPTSATIDLSVLVDFGADGPATNGGFTLDDVTVGGTLTPAVLDGDGDAVTVGGDAVEFTSFTDLGGVTTLTAEANGVVIFTLALTGDGQATLALIEEIDHGAASQIALDIGALVIATDFDGDSVTLPNDLVIFKVDDDVPQVVGDMMMVTVDEDDLGVVEFLPAGDDFVANTETSGSQVEPDIAGLAGGRFIVTWQDNGTGDGNGSAIRGRLFDADGNPVSVGGSNGDFVINTETPLNQLSTRVADLESGGFVVTWWDGGTGDGDGSAIRVRMFDADGHPTTVNGSTADFVVNTSVLDNQVFPCVTGLAGGGFVVTWTDIGTADGSERASRGRMFDANGNPVNVGGSTDDFVINTETLGSQDLPEVAALNNGGFVVIWTDLGTGDGSGAAVRGRIFDANGNPVSVGASTDDFVINTETQGEQNATSVTGLIGGGFVVTWVDSGTGDGSESAIRGRLFDANGNPVSVGGNTDDFVINTETADFQFHPNVTALNGGGFVVAWQDRGTGDGSDNAIRARAFDADGNPVSIGEGTDDSVINTEIPGDQSDPRVTALEDGGFAVTWQDGGTADGSASAIRVRIFNDVVTKSIDLAPKVDFGAEGPATGGGFALVDVTAGGTLTPAVLDNNGNALKSGGAAVVYSSFSDANGAQTLTAAADGDTVFTLALTGDGEATFTLFQNVDHNGADELQIDISTLISATDFEGDSITLPDDFVIFKVENDPDAPSYVSGETGVSDTLTSTSSVDFFVIDDLTAIDEIVGYEEQDSIDLSELLEANFNPAVSDPAEFVRLNGTDLEVDVDGGGDSFETAATFDSLSGIHTVTVILNDDGGVQTTDAITV